MGKLVKGADITEVYSPERVVEAARRMGLVGGLSLDLTTSDSDGRKWDFTDPEMRRRAIRHVVEDKPLLLIGSPMCTMFSTLQNLNWGKSANRDFAMQYKYEEAVKHMKFVASLYKIQVEAGRYFLHEHPRRAGSWNLKCIADILKDERVFRCEADMCQYGLQSKDAQGNGLALKPTSFMTNSPCIAKHLSRKCPDPKANGKAHRHVVLTCGRSRDAAKYTKELCEAICEGLIQQKELDRTGMVCMGEIMELS
jgi:hypothetical protein